MQLQYDPPLAASCLPNPFLQAPVTPSKTQKSATPISHFGLSSENVNRLLEANSDCI